MAVFAYPRPAAAFQLFGVCLIGECADENTDDINFIDPRRYELIFEVESQTKDDADNVEDAIKGSSQLWLGRDDAVAGASGLIARSKGDYRRILASLYDTGHYGGTISITINGAQASDLPAFRQLPQVSNVVVRVKTGSQYQFGEATIADRAPPATDDDDITPPLEDTGYIVGQPARAGAVRKAGKLAVEEWRQQGFAKAKVESREATALHPQKVLNVLMRMDPGQRAAYGPVTVEGTTRMDPDFVAYMTGLPEGEEFDPDDLERAQKRLDRLGVFSSRRIEEAEFINADGLLPLHVIVNERKKRRIGIGATLSSVDGIGIESYWLHRNLFGKAESLRLDARVGGIGSTISPDEFDYYLGGTFTKPGIYNPDTDLIANLFARREFNETFDDTSVGGSLGLKNYYSDRITFTGGVFANYGEFDDAFGERTFLTSGLYGSVLFDGRDNKLDPRSGLYASFDARPFYEWEFGNTAARFEAEGRGYFDLSSDGSSIFAARVKVGSLTGSSLAETPPDLLFTSGGGNSVRGFSFKSIGVEQPNGETSGGASLLEGSIELRQKINKSFGAVAFVDAGIVGDDALIGFEEETKIGVGVGIRYYTGLGPIRLDVAVPLNPGKDDAGFAIYAGVGQAF